jgi:hypothetical protein
MNVSQALDLNATNRFGISPDRRELLALLSEKYGVSTPEMEALDRTALMRVADTFDFLTNNLPPNSLMK